MAAKQNAIVDKSYSFALAAVLVCRDLQNNKEFVLSRQLLRSGRSIGANVEEAQAAQTKPDFISKMSVASKEARETRYWLRLINDSQLLDKKQIDPLMVNNDEFIRLLTSIVKTSQKPLNT